MITRTVRAENMLAALEIVKKELGADALVVSVRQVVAGPAWQVWRKPMVEVVAVQADEKEKKAGLTSILQKPAEPARQETPAPGGKKAYGLKEYRTAIQSGELEVESDPELENLLVHSQPAALPGILPSPAPLPKANIKPALEILERIQLEPAEIQERDSVSPGYLEKVQQFLLYQGIDEKILRQIIRNCEDTLGTVGLNDLSRVRECVQHQMEACIHIQKETTSLSNQVIFLGGVSGSGKTNTCAKLALHLTADIGRKVAWIEADTVRIGAIAEARAYAETIGIPLSLAYTPEDLGTEVERLSGEADTILVDTPAINPRQDLAAKDLVEMLKMVKNAVLWVTMPATAREQDIHKTLAAFYDYPPKGLVVTKLDETGSFSAIFNLAWKTQLPLVYYTFGNKVLNDLMPARSAQLVRSIFEERFVL